MFAPAAAAPAPDGRRPHLSTGISRPAITPLNLAIRPAAPPTPRALGRRLAQVGYPADEGELARRLAPVVAPPVHALLATARVPCRSEIVDDEGLLVEGDTLTRIGGTFPPTPVEHSAQPAA